MSDNVKRAVLNPQPQIGLVFLRVDIHVRKVELGLFMRDYDFAGKSTLRDVSKHGHWPLHDATH
jgi:hypothetical protein